MCMWLLLKISLLILTYSNGGKITRMTYHHGGQLRSAASERVFSLLANSFQCQQSSSLEDYNQSGQNGYQTVPFGVYIHNLMFVFNFE